MNEVFSKRKNEEPTEIEIDSKAFTIKNETIPRTATATPKHTHLPNTMPSRRTSSKAEDFKASLNSTNATIKKGRNASILGGLQKMIGSVQPNSDGDETGESSDEEEVPDMALTVVPSPTKGTKSKKVRYNTASRACQRPPPAIPRKKSI